VGDIHGCLQKLETLLKRMPFDPGRDFVVFLGDYINRGLESRRVVEVLLDLRGKVQNAVFLIGNHEHDLLEYARTGDPEHFRTMRPMGVEATLKSYGDHPVRALRDLSFLPAGHRSFLEHLLPYYRLDGYLFAHAGIIPGEDLDTCSLDRLLTVREPFLAYRKPLGATVVFGHTPFETPFVAHDKIGIDTGAVYGNLLTAVELPRLRFYHA
ncbi:MAG TPA: metallophosphoesterase, partial [Methanomicrobiales archaeon]|nr:metallophosphoesterase [Methanomicrobiales archaeon]